MYTNAFRRSVIAHTRKQHSQWTPEQKKLHELFAKSDAERLEDKKSTAHGWGKKPHTHGTAALQIDSVWEKAVRLFELKSGLLEQDLVKCKFPDKCQIWVGSKNNEGYPVMTVSLTKEERAEVLRAFGLECKSTIIVTGHRMAVYVASGAAKAGGATSHLCGNTLCVNPAHVMPGSQSENIRDGIQIGRVNKKGSNNKKWAFEDLVQIVTKILSGEMSSREAIRKHKISKGYMSALVNGIQRPDVLAEAQRRAAKQ